MGILDKTMDWLEEKLEPVNSSMDIITTPAGPTTEDPLFRDAFFHPSLIPDSEPCKAILHYHLGNTNLRVSNSFPPCETHKQYDSGVGSHHPNSKSCFPPLHILQVAFNSAEAKSYKLRAFSQSLLNRSHLQPCQRPQVLDEHDAAPGQRGARPGQQGCVGDH